MVDGWGTLGHFTAVESARRNGMNSFLKNILIGAGTVMVIWPASRATLARQSQSDGEALAADWNAIGGDFQRSLHLIDAEFTRSNDGSISTIQKPA